MKSIQAEQLTSLRELVRDILFDRWNLDDIMGDPCAEEIEDTLDEIEAVYVG